VFASSCIKPSCKATSDCPQGQACIDDGTAGRQCVDACAADQQCPAGEACVPRNDGSFEGACLAVTGTSKVGAACTDDRECATGACDHVASGTVCVDECNINAGAACPGNDRCTLSGLRHVCVPSSGNLDDGAQCQSSSQCTSGTCVVPPDASQSICAASCSAQHPCSASGVVCARLVGGADACLAPLGDGAHCADQSECSGGFCIRDFDNVEKCASKCSNGQCATGFSCETKVDSNGDGKIDASDTAVCMPLLSQNADGQTCAHDRDCASLHCAHFATATKDFGDLCASECASDGTCASPDVCWQKDPNDPSSVNVCGPQP
jgi:hypothetical protein